MEIETWAKNINKEVYEKWKRDYPLWDSGFKVFYSPVRKNPKLMILSYNPGGNETSFQEDLNHFEKGSYSGFMKMNTLHVIIQWQKRDEFFLKRTVIC